MKASEIQVGKIYKSSIGTSSYSWEVLAKGDRWYLYQRDTEKTPVLYTNLVTDIALDWVEVKPKKKFTMYLYTTNYDDQLRIYGVLASNPWYPQSSYTVLKTWEEDIEV